MGQSLVKNYLHIVFSTKNRIPLIQPPYEHELHNYIGGICKGIDCQPITTGGYTDHVHILCLLSKKIALVKLIEEVKSHSSKWMKTNDASLQNFYWQDGYGAFSVNPSQVDTVVAYKPTNMNTMPRKLFRMSIGRSLRNIRLSMMSAMFGIKAV